MTVPLPVALLLVLGVAPSSPSGSYTGVIEDYRRGDPNAVERLATVPEGIVAEEIRRLQKLRSLPKVRRDPRQTHIIDTYPYVAAAVLHTERGMEDDADGRLEAGNRHFGFARDWLRLALPDGDPAFRQWYLAVGAHLLELLQVEAADRLLVEGTKALPADARLWQTSGMAAEMTAHFTREADHVSSHSQRSLSERIATAAGIRGSFQAAEKRYRQALALDPTLFEARIHLGRVLTRLERPADAVAELETAIGQASDPAETYLVHLLAGRAEEGRGRLEEAAAHHRKATAALPGAEAGWVALAHVLDRLGERGPATAAVARVVGADSEYEIDPYRAYHVGPRGGPKAALAALKAWVK